MITNETILSELIKRQVYLKGELEKTDIAIQVFSNNDESAVVPEKSSLVPVDKNYPSKGMWVDKLKYTLNAIGKGDVRAICEFLHKQEPNLQFESIMGVISQLTSRMYKQGLIDREALNARHFIYFLPHGMSQRVKANALQPNQHFG